MEKQLFRNTIRVGNSAGVLLPKEWLNGYVEVKLVEKPINIKKDSLEILDPFLEDIIGIYLFGSYARKEQDVESDIDIIAISNTIKKSIVLGKYNVSIYPLKSVESAIKNNPLNILPMLLEAKTILNKPLLDNLLRQDFNKKAIKSYIDSSKRILKINKSLFNLDETLDENSIYSLILRLRGFYIISCLLKKLPSTKIGFKSFLTSEGLNFGKLYKIYQGVKLDKKESYILKKDESLKLLNFLEKQILKYDKA